MFEWLKRNKTKKVDFSKSEQSAWAETFNPLRNLTIDRAIRIYDNARMGAYAELQWLYQEIEAVHPTLFTCVERRSSALMETDYCIKVVDADKARGFDQSLAEDQQAFLKLAFADAENGNLNETIEHLGLGFFRGYAHAKPLYNNNGTTLEGFDILDNWNFCQDRHTGRWYWNPSAQAAINDNLQEIPAGELVTIARPRHVDYPALSIYIRAALGERKWGIFLERYGVPPVIITMPPDIDKDKEAAYLTAAESVAMGGSGALPNGSTASYATEARGTDPFSIYLTHQQEQIVLMSTGGILTSLSSPTGIGGGASDAHTQTWRTVIRRDCKLMTTPINRGPVEDLLNAGFPGKAHLAYFDFSDPKPKASEVFECAAKAKTAGYIVKKENLEEMTGYELELDTSVTAASLPYQIMGETLSTGETDKPATAPETLPPVEAQAAKVAETGMNGAQVTALLEVIAKVKSGEIDPAAAPTILKSAFPLLDDTKISEMLQISPNPASPATDPSLNKSSIENNSLQGHCKTTGEKIANKDTAKTDPSLDRTKTAFLSVSQKAVKAAAEVIEKGGSTDEAMAAYDAAALEVLNPETIAAAAEPIADILDGAAASGKELE